MGILDYSTTPSSNTAISGIGIAGSNSIKNGDDAMRQMMADTRSAVTRIAEKTAGSYTAAKADYNQLWRVTGAATINLTAAATLTAGWCLWVMADGATASIVPAGSEQIDGASSLSLTDGNSALVICTSTEFRTVIVSKPFDTDTLGNAAFLDVGTVAGTVAAGDDSRITGALPKSGGTMTGAITLDADPTSDMQAATKQYVDTGVAAAKTYSDGHAIGVDQTWEAPSRSLSTSYQNTTGKPIVVVYRCSGSAEFQVSSDGSTWFSLTSTSAGGDCITAIIPDGYYYKGLGSSVMRWVELR